MAVPSSGTVHLIGITKERAFDDYDTVYLVPRDVNQLSHPYNLWAWLTAGGNTNGARCTLSQNTTLTSPVTFPEDSVGTPLEMRLDAGSGGNDAYTYTYNTSAGSFNWDANNDETWTFSAWAKASKACTCGLWTFFAESDGTILSGNYGVDYISVTTSWQRFEATRKANHVDTEYFQVRFGGPASADDEIIYWDGAQVEEASSATSYSGPYTMLDNIDGGLAGGSGHTVPAFNTNSTDGPDTDEPHAFNEWYGYDDDEGGGGG